MRNYRVINQDLIQMLKKIISRTGVILNRRINGSMRDLVKMKPTKKIFKYFPLVSMIINFKLIEK